jgi:hypothetical protein
MSHLIGTVNICHNPENVSDHSPLELELEVLVKKFVQNVKKI